MLKIWRGRSHLLILIVSTVDCSSMIWYKYVEFVQSIYRWGLLFELNANSFIEILAFGIIKSIITTSIFSCISQITRHSFFQPHQNSLILHAFMDLFCSFVRVNLFSEKASWLPLLSLVNLSSFKLWETNFFLRKLVPYWIIFLLYLNIFW